MKHVDLANQGDLVANVRILQEAVYIPVENDLPQEEQSLVARSIYEVVGVTAVSNISI